MKKFFLATLFLTIFGVLLWSGFIVMNKSNNPVAQGTSVQQTPTPSPKKSYTLNEVSQHSTQTSCWSIVDNKVYDLTKWINNHPGGSDRILEICGIDGSTAFNSEHKGKREPANELAAFYIGDNSN